MESPWIHNMTKLEAQIVGNIELYYVSYWLSQLGWNVMPTATKAKGVDLIAYSLDGPSCVGVQIKPLSKRSPVPLGTRLNSILVVYWVITHKVVDSAVAFVMKLK